LFLQQNADYRLYKVHCHVLLSLDVVRQTVVASDLVVPRARWHNASVAIRKSILMDHVSLIACMSSASSVVGGYLIDAYSYRFCFRITAAFYFVALLVDVMLLLVVRDSNKQESAWILKEKAVIGSVSRSGGVV
jgi:hypothetical protein